MIYKCSMFPGFLAQRQLLDTSNVEVLAQHLRLRTGLEGAEGPRAVSLNLEGDISENLRATMHQMRQNLWVCTSPLDAVLEKTNLALLSKDREQSNSRGYALLRREFSAASVTTIVEEFAVERVGKGNLHSAALSALANQILLASQQVHQTHYSLTRPLKDHQIARSNPRIIIGGEHCLPRVRQEKFHSSLSGILTALRFGEENLPEQMLAFDRNLQTLETGYKGHPLLRTLCDFPDLRSLRTPPQTFFGDEGRAGRLRLLGHFWSQILEAVMSAVESATPATLYADNPRHHYNSVLRDEPHQRVITLQEKTPEGNPVGVARLLFPETSDAFLEMQFAVSDTGPPDTLAFLAAHALEEMPNTEWYQKARAQLR